MMFDIENAEAGYVLAAYGLAAVALLGLLVSSWRALRQRQSEWVRMQNERSLPKS